MSDMEQLSPHDREAERGILATCLRNRDPQCVSDAVAMLRPDDFYIFAHQKIFEAIASLASENKPVDAVTVGRWLVDRQLLVEIGGAVYLGELAVYAGNAHI